MCIMHTYNIITHNANTTKLATDSNTGVKLPFFLKNSNVISKPSMLPSTSAVFYTSDTNQIQIKFALRVSSINLLFPSCKKRFQP